VVDQVVVKRLVLSEQDRIGIGTFQPKDEKNQDSTELTGDINYPKIAEFSSESDPRAFKFDCEFNVANRGVIPYVTKLSDEQKIYEKDYNTKRVRGEHMAPHTLEMGALWAVLSRLEDPKNAGLTLLQKVKLYNGKTLPGFTLENNQDELSATDTIEIWRRVDKDAQRLMERADEVFALRMIDADFSADRAVDVGQERGGNLHERDAAGVGGRREAGRVSHDAAPHGHDDGPAIRLHFDQRVVETGDDGQRLRLFPGLQIDATCLPTGVAQTFRRDVGVRPRDMAVADDESFPRR
jgi:hypothetical protein